MKTRIGRFFGVYFLWVVCFVLQKPFFLLVYGQNVQHLRATDWLSIMYHGLPLDFSMAGYLSVIPALLLLPTLWRKEQWPRRTLMAYFGCVSTIVGMAFILNLVLYGYWGFPLDSTPLFYFFSSPQEAVASVSVGFLLLGLLLMALCSVAIYAVFYFFLLRPKRWPQFERIHNRAWKSLALFLLTAALFLPIRGGITTSTMNVGKVFYSSDPVFNHAAVNPLFSLMESLVGQEDFAKQYRFMDDHEATRFFRSMQEQPEANVVLSDSLLTTQRPNVMIVVMESFSNFLMKETGGLPNVAVNLDSIARTGVLFTNFYANSFRTDRGLVSILSGYPAQPTMSIMKYPSKTAHLPSICGALLKVGYRPKYYYGGDADFTKMRSYLVAQGFTDIVSDQNFPVGDRLSKWGVHDHLLFRKVWEELRSEKTQQQPFFRVVQTSSSHEPFDVPYHRLSDERLNAFAYTDSVIGDFLRNFRTLPAWKNTLVILVPDHLGCYPPHISNFDINRYRIPLILTGGAVREPKRIDIIGGQQDIAATLLAQLGLSHKEFAFSKNLFNPHTPHFAFFAVPDAFGLVTTDNQLIYDNQAHRVMLDTGRSKGQNLQPAKAYLQKLYDDIAKR